MSPLIPPSKPAQMRLADLVAEMGTGGPKELVRKELEAAFPVPGGNGKHPQPPDLDPDVVTKLSGESVSRVFLASLDIQRSLVMTLQSSPAALVISNGAGSSFAIRLPTAAEHQTSANNLPTYMAANVRKKIELEAQATAPDLFVLWAAGVGATPHTAELCDVVSLVTASIVFAAKYLRSVPRPHVLNPAVAPQLEVPLHSSYPGGHSTTAFALAEVLAAVTAADVPRTAFLRGMATRLGRNRMSAGLHTAVDTDSGELLGRGLGNLLVRSTVGPSSSIYDTMYRQACAEW